MINHFYLLSSMEHFTKYQVLWITFLADSADEADSADFQSICVIRSICKICENRNHE